MILPLLVIFTAKIRLIESEVYEIRVHEDASPGSKITMSEDLEKKFYELRDCFGELQSNITWIDFSSEKWMFRTREKIKNTNTSTAIIQLLCAANQMHTINLKIRITRKNRHPPTFSQNFYNFYVPTALEKGSILGSLKVADHDSVIYNSQTKLSVLENGGIPVVNIGDNGTLLLIKNLKGYQLFRPINYRLLANDYGSPQLFSFANLTIIPVPVSEVRYLHVNFANIFYQIFEWESPLYGKAEKFRILVQNNGTYIREEEIIGNQNIALLRNRMQLNTNYTVQIFVVDSEGVIPSKKLNFSVFSSELECDGECSLGGRPICYYKNARNIAQYRDENGLHCLCYQGFTGNMCEDIEQCIREMKIEAYGKMEWRSTKVNETSRISCPFGPENEILRRRCSWNEESASASWELVVGEENCRKQSSILIHLGIMANYAENAKVASALETIHRFLNSLLKLPAFNPNITNVYFDTQIAEHVVEIVDLVLIRRWEDIVGNTTDIQLKFLSFIDQFTQVLPYPYTVSSENQGLVIKTVEWTENSKVMKQMRISHECQVRLPIVEKLVHIRFVCMRNSTIYSLINDANPLLIMEIEENIEFDTILIELRPYTMEINFTCVRFDHKENKWTTSGITLMDDYKNDLVKCETKHFGLYSLLPVSKVNTSRSLLAKDFLALVLIISTVFLLLCCIIQLFVLLFKWENTTTAIHLIIVFTFSTYFTYFLILLFDTFKEELNHTFNLYLFIFVHYFISALFYSIIFFSFFIRYRLKKLKENNVNRKAKTSCIRTSSFIIGVPTLIVLGYYLPIGGDIEKCLYLDGKISALIYFIPLFICAIIILISNLLTLKISICFKRRIRYINEKEMILKKVMQISICLPMFCLFCILDFFAFFHRYNQYFAILTAFLRLLISLIILLLPFFTIVLSAWEKASVEQSPTRILERKRDISEGNFLENDRDRISEINNIETDTDNFMHNSLNNCNDLPSFFDSNNIYNIKFFPSNKPLVSIV